MERGAWSVERRNAAGTDIMVWQPRHEREMLPLQHQKRGGACETKRSAARAECVA
jgi:hypothetical protein